MKKIFGTLVVLIALGGLVHFVYGKINQNTLSEKTPMISEQNDESFVIEEIIELQNIPQNKSIHLETPKPLKAFYISSWVTATPRIFNPIIEYIKQSEINAVVLDIKDDTGRVSFLVDDPIITTTGSPENRIKNIEKIIQDLNDAGIYVIGRISVFQDPYLTKKYPDWAIKDKTSGDIWRDRKGLSFLNPAKPEVWNYIVALARASFDKGFDEVNFDYIRYPSDGIISNIDYELTTGQTRADHIRDFFAFLHQELKTSHPYLPISADLFGLTTTAKDDLGIGQIWENALPYFDYIAPMVYPSHYAPGSFGILKPAEEPYRIVKNAMIGAIMKTESAGYSRDKIRPWLQDFNLGAFYDTSKIQDQIRAVEEQGIDSWMMWDPANTYTYNAYQKREIVLH